MCEICHKSPCPAQCPNADPPEQVYICSGCGQPIYEGEDYYEILGEQFCDNCILDARKEAQYDPY